MRRIVIATDGLKSKEVMENKDVVVVEGTKPNGVGNDLLDGQKCRTYYLPAEGCYGSIDKILMPSSMLTNILLSVGVAAKFIALELQQGYRVLISEIWI